MVKALEPLLSVAEVAEVLDVSPNILRQWLSQRRLPIVKVGRLTKLRPADVEGFIARNRREACPVAQEV